MPDSMMQSEAYKVGMAHGYAHANYADNVSGVIPDAETDSETATPPGYITSDQESAYRTGYRDGIDDYFENGQPE